MIAPVAWAVLGVASAALLSRNVNQTLLIRPHWPDAEPEDSRQSNGAPFRFNHTLPGIGWRRSLTTDV